MKNGGKGMHMAKLDKPIDTADTIDDIVETMREVLEADRKNADVESMFQQLKLKLKTLKDEERKKIKRELKDDVFMAVMFGPLCDLEKRLNKIFD